MWQIQYSDTLSNLKSKVGLKTLFLVTEIIVLYELARADITEFYTLGVLNSRYLLCTLWEVWD